MTTIAVVSPELKAILRRLKLSPMLDTLPERVALARQAKMPHQDFLELVLSDEVTRRDSKSAVVRAHRANLDPTMVLEAWDDSSGVTFDRDLWSELTTGVPPVWWTLNSGADVPGEEPSCRGHTLTIHRSSEPMRCACIAAATGPWRRFHLISGSQERACEGGPSRKTSMQEPLRA